MRRVQIHAQHLDLSVHRSHPRPDLVERRDHVALGVAVHGACECEARELVDGDVQERGAVVHARRAQLEHVEDPQRAELGQGRVDTRGPTLGVKGRRRILADAHAPHPGSAKSLTSSNVSSPLEKAPSSLTVGDSDGERHVTVGECRRDEEVQRL